MQSFSQAIRRIAAGVWPRLLRAGLLEAHASSTARERRAPSAEASRASALATRVSHRPCHG